MVFVGSAQLLSRCVTIGALTTNLGVRSSNLFGRASSISYLSLATSEGLFFDGSLRQKELY